MTRLGLAGANGGPMTNQQMHEYLISARNHINEALGDLNIIECGDAEDLAAYYQHAHNNADLAQSQAGEVSKALQTRLTTIRFNLRARCGHSACSQNYIDTGETNCIK